VKSYFPSLYDTSGTKLTDPNDPEATNFGGAGFDYLEVPESSDLIQRSDGLLEIPSSYLADRAVMETGKYFSLSAKDIYLGTENPFFSSDDHIGLTALEYFSPSLLYLPGRPPFSLAEHVPGQGLSYTAYPRFFIYDPDVVGTEELPVEIARPELNEQGQVEFGPIRQGGSTVSDGGPYRDVLLYNTSLQSNIQDTYSILLNEIYQYNLNKNATIGHSNVDLAPLVYGDSYGATGPRGRNGTQNPRDIGRSAFNPEQLLTYHHKRSRIISSLLGRGCTFHESMLDIDLLELTRPSEDTSELPRMIPHTTTGETKNEVMQMMTFSDMLGLTPQEFLRDIDLYMSFSNYCHGWLSDENAAVARTRFARVNSATKRMLRDKDPDLDPNAVFDSRQKNNVRSFIMRLPNQIKSLMFQGLSWLEANSIDGIERRPFDYVHFKISEFYDKDLPPNRAVSNQGPKPEEIDLMADPDMFGVFWLNYKALARLEIFMGYVPLEGEAQQSGRWWEKRPLLKSPVWRPLNEEHFNMLTHTSRHDFERPDLFEGEKNLVLCRFTPYCEHPDAKYFGITKENKLKLPIYNKHFLVNFESLTNLWNFTNPARNSARAAFPVRPESRAMPMPFKDPGGSIP